jgi:hypothetical protein
MATSGSYKGGKLSPSATEAQVLAYLDAFGGTVTAAEVKENPSLKGLQGQTAPQVYAALKKANPSATPYTLAQAITEIWIGGGLSGATLGLVSSLGAALQATEKGIAKTSFVPSWADGLAQLLADLTNSGTWVRVAKVAIGSVLVVVGFVKMTGTGKAIEGAVLK